MEVYEEELVDALPFDRQYLISIVRTGLADSRLLDGCRTHYGVVAAMNANVMLLSQSVS